MAITISRDRRTTADDADAVVFTAAEGSVRNAARVSTLGDRADAIRGAGDRLSVVNGGRVETSGDGAAAITIDGNDARVTNDGAIQVAGGAIFAEDAAPIFADAISVRGDRFDLLNRGSITIGTAQGGGGDNAGLSGSGDGGTVRNAGSISANGDYVLGAGVSGAGNAVTNDGAITIRGVAGAALFAFGGPGNRLLNGGSIDVTGDFAVGALLAAPDGSIDNRGSVAVAGIGAYALFGVADGAMLTNSGKIAVRSQVTSDDPPIASAAMIALGDGTSLVNTGQITTSGRFALGIGAGDGATRIDNAGRIETSGDYSSGIRVGVVSPDDLTADDAMVRNGGSIRTAGDASVGVLLVGDDNRFVNAGRIQTSGGVGSEGILGMLPAAGVVALGDGVVVTNEANGQIAASGRGSPGVALNILDVGDASATGTASTFVNRGTVQAGVAVQGGDGEERVDNAGLLRGDVRLGGGDDVYVAERGGRLDGVLTLGAGDDLVVVQRGAGRLVIDDFVAGARSDDVLDLSALGFRDLGSVLAASRQVGGDVFIRGSGGEQITLQHVLLGTLSADDFVFAPTAT